MALLLALAGTSLFASTAVAKRPVGATQISRAKALAGHVPKKSWARSKRARVLRQATLALRSLKRRRTCQGLSQSERFRGGLRDSRNWKRHTVPTRRLKKPLRLLAFAGKRLLKKAGPRCAIPVKRSRAVRRHRGGRITPKVTPPTDRPEQGGGAEDEEEGFDLKQGKLRTPRSLGRPADVDPDPHLTASAAFRPLSQAAADDAFTFFRNTDLGVPTVQSYPMEPTSAEGGGVVWYTGNSMVALSTNAGLTFSYFNPSNVLPDDGLAFCCDQVVSYDSKNGFFVWESQYWCAAGTTSPPDTTCKKDGHGPNRIRFAIATPDDLIRYAANPKDAWTYWDVTPKDLKLPAGAWFDRSDMSIDDWYVNWTVDTLESGKVRSILARYPLEAFRRRPASVRWFYETDTNARFAVAQGRHDGTIFVSANSQSQFRIFSWERAADKLFRHDVNHTTVPMYALGATGADGANWLSRQAIFPGSPDSATVSGDTLYVATTTGRAYCKSKCDGASPELQPSPPFAHPSVYVGQFDVNSWKSSGEEWLWRPDTAYAWPALATDRAGDVGIAMHSAAAGGNPEPVAGFLTPARELVTALTAVGDPLTGDYYSLRPGRTKRSFVTTSATFSGAPPAYHWNYIEFGYGPSPYVSPPTVGIDKPAELERYTIGDLATFSAVGQDRVDGKLPESAFVWSYDGAEFARGTSVASHLEAAAGIHTITVTATNADGASSTAQVHIRVKPPAVPGAPIVHILSPADGGSLCATATDGIGEFRTVQFTASAVDPSSPPGPLTYTWTDSINGAPAQTVSSALSPALNLHLPNNNGRSATHDLSLRVTNSTGSNSDEVRVTIRTSVDCVS